MGFLNTLGVGEVMRSVVSCKICSQPSKVVSFITLQHLLKPQYQSTLNPSHSYYFCDVANCQVVYFSPDTDIYFYKDDLTVRVGLKEPCEPKPVCYCFNFTEELILEEITSKGHSTVAEQIKTAIKTIGCDCKRKNPSGNCCLNDIAQIVKFTQPNIPNNGAVKSLPQLNCCK